ncbi:MAG TPA: lytic murein transglycosylase B [Burkholderiaceae bacterium]|nr:lytic murein transglycosylase B [Burkholderiaceae bacterium]
MFRRSRILQAIIPALLTTACASPQPEALHRNINAVEPAAGSALPSPRAAALPDIQAGDSEASSRPFVGPDGQLDPAIEAFAREVALQRQLPLDHVTTLLREARYNATAARLMSPSKTRIRRSWVTYRGRFVEPIRIRNGEQFWREHADELARAEAIYGVPASIIVAIIGVETLYGRHTGDFRVLDALATLGFRYPDPTRPERAHMFRNQLADLITLDHQGLLDARTATGSFAGAMGLPQFMPGSLARFAADGDGDGHIDLHGSASDAIVSVARFLRLHGWRPELPVFAPVTPPGNAQQWVTGGLTPTLKWEELQAGGARLAGTATAMAWQAHPLGMVDLVDEPRNSVEYRVGTLNFFALTHYNRSYFYASSVADLAQELERRMNAAPSRAQLKTPVER